MSQYFQQLGKSEARKNFLSILNGFAEGILRPILVTDHGKAQAVILPYQEYNLLTTKAKNYDKSKKSAKKVSIFGDDLELKVDLEKHNWNDFYEEWLAKWDKEQGDG